MGLSLGPVSSSPSCTVGSLWLRCAIVVSLAGVSGSAAGTLSLLLGGFLKLGEPQEQPGACHSQDGSWEGPGAKDKRDKLLEFP